VIELDREAEQNEKRNQCHPVRKRRDKMRGPVTEPGNQRDDSADPAPEHDLWAHITLQCRRPNDTDFSGEKEGA
jgi:hypothetical protein